MATLAQIREGLATRIKTISGLRASAYIQFKPDPPVANVVLAPTEFNLDFDGTWNPKLTIWVFVNPASPTAQQALDTYLAPTGTKSIAAASHADPSLGGVVESTKVTGIVTGPGLVGTAGSELLGAALGVEVIET